MNNLTLAGIVTLLVVCLVQSGEAQFTCYKCENKANKPDIACKDGDTATMAKSASTCQACSKQTGPNDYVNRDCVTYCSETNVQKQITGAGSSIIDITVSQSCCSSENCNPAAAPRAAALLTLLLAGIVAVLLR